MMTTGNLDLDALAEWVNHELESYSTRTNTFRLADVLALIQRLREAEAERDWAIGQSKTAVRHWNSERQQMQARIAQLEAENQHLTETGTELIRMTLKLERVRETATELKLSMAGLRNSITELDHAPWLRDLDRLVAALAAVEEK